ncbi:unnamed protein product [Scytosiphon promiscuus]
MVQVYVVNEHGSYFSRNEYDRSSLAGPVVGEELRQRNLRRTFGVHAVLGGHLCTQALSSALQQLLVSGLCNVL